MGLFKKKKEEQSATEDVTWADIERSMNAPDIPDDQPEWFRQAAVNPANLKTLARDAHIWENSWFNVETAAVFVGNRIPEYCESCSEGDSCIDCGKNSTNYISAMSANRDCDVLVWSLSSSAILAGLGIADGAFMFFDPAVYGTLSKDDGFSFTSQNLAPVLIGELEIKDVGDDTGTLFLGDANGSVDGNYFFTGIPVLSGKYKVVTWIGYTQTGELAPQALGVYGSGYDELLKSDLKSSVVMTKEIERIVKGGEDVTVFARMGNNQEHYSAVNEEINSNRHSLPNSWWIQLAAESDFEKLLSGAQSGSLSGAVGVAESLRLRGKRSYSQQFFSAILERPDVSEDADIKNNILKMSSREVGIHTPLPYRVSSWALFREGRELRNNGRVADALDKIEESAKTGFPIALEFLIWNYLQEGDYSEGIRKYEELKVWTHQSLNEDTAKCDSNFALLKLASGGTLRDALDIWLPNIEYYHPETILFSGMAHAQLGEREESELILANMNDDEWNQVEESFNGHISNSKGWCKDWYKDAEKFRRKVAP